MLRQPNTSKDTKYFLQQEYPYEFDLHKYVGYETQFTKTFTDLFMICIRYMNKKLERELTLESFFV